MQSFVHTFRWPAMLLIAMSGMIVSVANLQAQAIPPKLAASDQVPSELRGIQPDTERPPSGAPSQAQLVQVLQQRGVSVDAQTLAANRGKRKLRPSSQVPSEFRQPGNRGDSGVRLQRPTQAALLQRMRQTPGGRARLDEARQRGAPLETSTGQVPRSGGGSYGLASAEMASVAGPTWRPVASKELPTPESGDWQAFFTANKGTDGQSSLHFYRATVQFTHRFYLINGGCAAMSLVVPADGWYLVWWMVNIPSRASWIVKTSDGTELATFTGNGTTAFYPFVLEMGSGTHWIRACNPSSRGNVVYVMSGAYDIP